MITDAVSHYVDPHLIWYRLLISRKLNQYSSFFFSSRCIPLENRFLQEFLLDFLLKRKLSCRHETRHWFHKLNVRWHHRANTNEDLVKSHSLRLDRNFQKKISLSMLTVTVGNIIGNLQNEHLKPSGNTMSRCAFKYQKTKAS